jgi:hypothetical protein
LRHGPSHCASPLVPERAEVLSVSATEVRPNDGSQSPAFTLGRPSEDCGAGGGTRTRTEVALLRILSPLRMPFPKPGPYSNNGSFTEAFVTADLMDAKALLDELAE